MHCQNIVHRTLWWQLTLAVDLRLDTIDKVEEDQGDQD